MYFYQMKYFISAICSLLCIFSWLVQYLTKFRHNVLTLEELEQHWISEYRACMGFSFYLVVIATVLFMVTVSTLAIIIKQPWVDRKLRSELRKKLSSRNFVPHSASSTMTKKSKDGMIPPWVWFLRNQITCFLLHMKFEGIKNWDFEVRQWL